MQLFYVENLKKNSQLSQEESNHCLLVLRKKINEKIYVTDGHGTIYSTIISNVDNKIVQFKNLSKKYIKPKEPKVHIAIALTKNRTRFEWFLEKATELGIDEITPLICENSERKKFNIIRSKKILISALKQSNNCILPKLNNITNFTDFLPKSSQNTYIAHCHDKPKKDLKDILKTHEKNDLLTIIIGPEGDFTKDEILLGEKFNINGVKLSQQRLRTETAGIVACHMMKLLL